MHCSRIVRTVLSRLPSYRHHQTSSCFPNHLSRIFIIAHCNELRSRTARYERFGPKVRYGEGSENAWTDVELVASPRSHRVENRGEFERS
jgi:hypothetical protein